MIFYTDGSASPNPGPGGFGVVQVDTEGAILSTYSSRQDNTTNNEQEMKAILYAACQGVLAKEDVLIYSDSAYAINTFSNWMYNWERNGWIKGDGRVPENLEVVQAFFEVSKMIEVTFVKVKGHSKNPFNELADNLATGKVKPGNYLTI